MIHSRVHDSVPFSRYSMPIAHTSRETIETVIVPEPGFVRYGPCSGLVVSSCSRTPSPFSLLAPSTWLRDQSR